MDESGDLEENPLPLSLRVVAYLTILFGIGSVVDFVVSIFQGKLSISLGVLQIPAGFGLLRLNRGWRTFVLICLWLGFIGSAILIYLLEFRRLTITGPLPRPLLLGYGREIALTSVVVWLCFMLWEYRVLTNPRIKRLFGL